MSISWNISLVVLSVIVAIVGSFTALTHAQRMRETRDRFALMWMALGAMTLGLTIWSMHFIDMLAFHLPIEINFDFTLTLLSVVPAVGASLLGFFVLRDTIISLKRIILSGILMGLGIAAMHYTGMAALIMSPPIQYSPGIVLLSIIVAIVASWGALMMMYQGERIKIMDDLRFALGSIVMGLAISGMHYTGMQGLTIDPNSICLSNGSPLNTDALVLMLSLICLIWFGGGIVTALFDRRRAHQNTITLRRLEQAHVELEKAHVNLEQTATAKAREMTRDLLNSEARTRAVINAALDCIITIDALGRILEFNPAAEITFGHTRAAVLGKDLAETIIPPAYREKHRLGLARMSHHGTPTIIGKRVELTAMRANGEEFPVELTLSQFLQNEKSIFTGFLRDITEQKKAETNIHHLAFYDVLTKLPNRRLLQEKLEHAISASARRHHYAAILFIDLDNFKTLNDTRGHNIGDLLLIEVAARLTELVRDEDTVARLGGDEFVILLEDLGPSVSRAAINAETIAEKIREYLNMPYVLQEQSHRSSPSIGITLFLNREQDVGELLKRADAAMYQAKHAGRNTIRFFDPEMQSALEARMTMEDDLRRAIKFEQFVLYYQPLVDHKRKIFGAEALLRWKHPTRGLMLPGEFIPLAEETGLILPLGHWVMQRACQQLNAWAQNPLTSTLQIAVNVSPRRFQQPDFVEEVLSVIEQTGAPAHQLKLELTEGLVLEDVTDTIDKMRTLREHGIQFALDDFGTGYSSLTYLKRLPLTQLKIDRSFIHDINLRDDAIVKTIIGMAKSLEMEVLAEGVETQSQLDFLVNNGCKLYQGFLFGAPMPLEMLEAHLKQTA